MEDFKTKLFEIIRPNQERNKIPIISNNEANNFPLNEENRVSGNVSYGGENSNVDILQDVESVYFEEDFDPSKYELEKLHGGNASIKWLENNLHRLRSQLAMISKRVLCMILDNRLSCQNEFQRMCIMEKLLLDALSLCQEARAKLKKCDEVSAVATLLILRNYRKRKMMRDVLRFLQDIKALLQMECRLESMFTEGNYLGAIQLLLDFQSSARHFQHHFTCVSILASKFNDTLAMAEEQLDVALAKVCYEFKVEVYGELQHAYDRLGKRRMAVDQLHMHYTNAIHSTAYYVLSREAIVNSSFSNIDEGVVPAKKTYATLCKEISDEKFAPCLLKLCQKLWNILNSYGQVVSWHHSNIVTTGMMPEDDINSITAFELNIDEQYIKNKFERGRSKIWKDIENRVITLISNSNLPMCKSEDFLFVVKILSKLLEGSREFYNHEDGTCELQLFIHQQSNNYFERYHFKCMEELRIFVENECWTICPVKEDFNILHFTDLQHYQNHNAVFQDSNSENPFEGLCTDLKVDVEKAERDIEDEDIFSQQGTVFLTNSSLTILRYCGHYLQMAHLLPCIIRTVISCLKKLFEYYLHAVFTLFAQDIPTVMSLDASYSVNKMQAVVKRIEESWRVELPEIMSLNLDLTCEEKLFALKERIVAIESMDFLTSQLSLLREWDDSYMSGLGNKELALDLFHLQLDDAGNHTKKVICDCVVRKVVDAKYILSLMSRVNWQVKDVICQHNEYVDVLFRQIQVFCMRLDEVSDEIPRGIPPVIMEYLWIGLIQSLNELFVEGFSHTKKCSNGGRALMQLDYAQFMSKLEAVCPLKKNTLPKRELVDSYVKAFYLPESALLDWITNHMEYSQRQLQSLIHCACPNNKKARQKLMEELDRLKCS